MTEMANVAEKLSPEEEREQLIDALSRGHLRMHQIPDYYSAREKVTIRREALEKRAGVDLKNMGHYSLDDERAFHIQTDKGEVGEASRSHDGRLIVFLVHQEETVARRADVAGFPDRSEWWRWRLKGHIAEQRSEPNEESRQHQKRARPFRPR